MNSDNNKLQDLTEILKNAPEGLKVWTTMSGRCRLDAGTLVSDGTIKVTNDLNWTWPLDRFGRLNGFGKCVVFPAADVYDWNGWQRHLLANGQYIKLKGRTALITDIITMTCMLPDGTKMRFRHGDAVWASRDETNLFKSMSHSEAEPAGQPQNTSGQKQPADPGHKEMSDNLRKGLCEMAAALGSFQSALDRLGDLLSETLDKLR